ncbi:MAG: hypothetical protein K0R40_1117, partial [Burkholderiales bacterium]|nr:hypothetical protein [Burkholderiales bacterium]
MTVALSLPCMVTLGEATLTEMDL